MSERDLLRLVGKMCSWTPNMSDEVGVNARIADVVLAPTDEILVLIIPVSGRGGTWVMGDEVIVDGIRLGVVDWPASTSDRPATGHAVPCHDPFSLADGDFSIAEGRESQWRVHPSQYCPD